MAKSKEKKKAPKPPENAASVVEMRKEIAARKEKLGKRKEAATKDGKLNKFDAKYRLAVKRLKRAQRKLADEAIRLRIRKPVEAAPVGAAAPAAAAEAPAAATPAAAAPAAEAEKK